MWYIELIEKSQLYFSTPTMKETVLFIIASRNKIQEHLPGSGGGAYIYWGCELEPQDKLRRNKL